jgi:ring-1,2-phenylacetyl-CoA epoxidase subunit PaaD
VTAEPTTATDQASTDQASTDQASTDQASTDEAADEVRRRVEAVVDPELPVLTLGQLGVIRAVHVDQGEHSAVVEMTPTYSGCPAIEVMGQDVAAAVRSAGYRPEVRVVLSPAWSTDWISLEGRKALSEAGIAPPSRVAHGPVRLEIGSPPTRPDSALAAAPPTCPLCGSAEVEELARFGSTACKSLWRCLTCREPFDHVKPL